jgi:hypothetical protein
MCLPRQLTNHGHQHSHQGATARSSATGVLAFVGLNSQICHVLQMLALVSLPCLGGVSWGPLAALDPASGRDAAGLVWSLTFRVHPWPWILPCREASLKLCSTLLAYKQL